MFISKYTLFICIGLLINSCGDQSHKSNDFKIKTNAKNKRISNSETLTISIDNTKNYAIDSVTYMLSGKSISNALDLTNKRLGKHNLEATIYYNSDKSQTVTQKLFVLNHVAPKIYSYIIVNEYPHDINSYTQGLEFYKDTLYESTGQYKESKLRKLDYKTGQVYANVDLANDYFGEGLTILNNKVYQLTWKAGTGLIYDATTLNKLSSFKYGKSKEGWGICNDGTILYKSDGSEKIWLLNPKTLVEEGYIEVYHNRGKVVGLNELEWIEGKIYANRYQKNGVAIINPKNGAIEGVIDFTSLKNKVKQHQGLDVLNGIAYNPKTKSLFVTGKHWNKVFEVKIEDN